MMTSVGVRKKNIAPTQPLVTLSTNIQQFADGVCRSVAIGQHFKSSQVK